MGGVFLNYRTGDGDWAAALIKRELASQFGIDSVFYAGESIRLGEDFAGQILSRLAQCEVLLAVIGPRWLNATDRHGVRRLDKPDDWVRREISEAFQLDVRVVPVLLDGIDRLTEASLPGDIARLARCQFLRMHHRSDDFDLTRLLDELTELVPSLAVTTAPQPTGRRVPHMTGQTGDCASLDPIFPFASGPQSDHEVNGGDGELRSTVTRLRLALSDPGGRVAVQDIVHVATTQALEALADSRYPISLPVLGDNLMSAALEERLTSYEQDMTCLLRLVAIGTSSGDDRHDNLWLRAVNRVLNRRDQPAPASAVELWVAAELYPALLLIYTIGVASMAAGRDDLVYRLLTRTMLRTARRTEQPVLRALPLRHVIDPRYSAAFPKWDGAHPHHALSVHLRQVLRPAFGNVLDEHEYVCAFEEYEYLRSLLELHDRAFSSLGEFSVHLDEGSSSVHQRMKPRLTVDSRLLRAGAFDGDAANVTEARRRLQESTRARYL